MVEIEVTVSWEDKNFACGVGIPEVGAIVCTNKNINALLSEFEETLKWHIREMIKDGEEVPAYLANGDYSIVYVYTIAAVLRKAECFTTMAAISRACGINQKLLGHYANNLKKPRDEQRKKIVDGIHRIGRECLSVC